LIPSNGKIRGLGFSNTKICLLDYNLHFVFLLNVNDSCMCQFQLYRRSEATDASHSVEIPQQNDELVGGTHSSHAERGISGHPAGFTTQTKRRSPQQFSQRARERQPRGRLEARTRRQRLSLLYTTAQPLARTQTARNPLHRVGAPCTAEQSWAHRKAILILQHPKTLLCDVTCRAWERGDSKPLDTRGIFGGNAEHEHRFSQHRAVPGSYARGDGLAGQPSLPR